MGVSVSALGGAGASCFVVAVIEPEGSWHTLPMHLRTPLAGLAAALLATLACADETVPFVAETGGSGDTGESESGSSDETETTGELPGDESETGEDPGPGPGCTSDSDCGFEGWCVNNECTYDECLGAGYCPECYSDNDCVGGVCIDEYTCMFVGVTPSCGELMPVVQLPTPAGADELEFIAVAAGDIDGDGDDDIAALVPGGLAAFFNGELVTTSVVDAPWEYLEYLGGIHANDDGWLDLIAIDAGKKFVFLGDGAGGFVETDVLSGSVYSLPKVGDFDGDGDFDFALGGDHSTRAWLNDGGTFVNAPSLDAIDARAGVGDFDFDGRDELIFGHQPILARLVDGTDWKLRSVTTLGEWEYEDYLTVALPGEGRLELLGLSPANNNSIFTIWRGSEASGDDLKEVWSSVIPGQFQDLIAGDFDGDGWPTVIALYGYNSRYLSVLGFGPGAEPCLVNTTLPRVARAAFGDFDGDGDDELAMVVSEFPDHHLQIWDGDL